MQQTTFVTIQLSQKSVIKMTSRSLQEIFDEALMIRWNTLEESEKTELYLENERRKEKESAKLKV